MRDGTWDADQEIRALLETIPEAFVGVDSHWRVTAVNARAAALAAHPEDRAVGAALWDAFPDLAAPAWKGRYEEALAAGLPTSFEIEAADGRWLGVRAEPSGGGLSLFFSDVTERRRMRGELEEARRELETFSYGVSHDLRAPLRAIEGFSHLLLSRHAAELSDDAAEFVSLMRDAVARMGRFVDDLLGFTRLRHHVLEPAPCSVAELAHDVIELASTDAEDPPADFVVHYLPPCHADRSLLRQLLASLIDNALKFSSGEPARPIEIGAKGTDGEPIYYVRDHGIGFEMRFAERIFGPFERLHAPDQYPGTGMGLAIAHRIVTLHGGRIWAQSAPGEGATFYFTLGPSPSLRPALPT